ncbi:TPM domain-containing protein [Stenotrophomonas mori]|uniref:TPM domain-containing protein n=1 Tax=Stenotrophomonas mori TaxID=2871096 RepID=A0ABT0SJ06_9GAMM|nr:TPM domain-containing protein [Stenotrophomonas mori]MCL7715101.1 TPM domain-containing protein [Stenotrophomonas mori]
MRWLRHLFAGSAHARFSEACLERIADAIADGERTHSGQVMFAVEADLPLAALWRGVTPRERAEQAFALLRTWDTEANNGVLVYLLLADHAIEIVADRGLHAHVDARQWQRLCEDFGRRQRAGELEAAVRATVAEVSRLLAGPYPALPGQARGNELPDRPQVLG